MRRLESEQAKPRKLFYNRLRDRDGFTLVELMVSAAILGVLALASAVLVSSVTELGVKTNNAANLSEDLSFTSQVLSQYIGNATQFICNCRSGTTAPVSAAGRDCLYVESDPDTKDTCTETPPAGVLNSESCTANYTVPGGVAGEKIVAAFIAEVHPNPLRYSEAPGNEVTSNADCIGGTGGMHAAFLQMYSATTVNRHHGCKKFYVLVYQPPSMQAASASGVASQPGKLELYDVTSSFLAQPNISPTADTFLNVSHLTSTSKKLIARLENISSFRCGLESDSVNGDLRSSMRGFKFLANIKMTNRKPLAGELRSPKHGSFHPLDVNDLGTGVIGWRRMSETIPFRNLINPGIHFGLVQTGKCVSAPGVPVSSFRECCSQYVESSGGGFTCTYGCTTAGNAATDAGECCSYMLGGGICQ